MKDDSQNRNDLAETLPIQPHLPAALFDLPGYTLLEKLGEGSMGVVYKAQQHSVNRVVAVKVLATESMSSAAVQRFQTEAQAAGKLEHHNIVHVHDVGEHQGMHFIAMSLEHGQSLDESIQSQLPAPRTAAELIRQIAEAMHYAHQQGVVHRDLKPSNILLTEEGTPKIVDFGLAKKVDGAAHTTDGQFLGTPSYMSPEQAQGHAAEADARADVYSIGAIIYELLTGRPPYVGEHALSIIGQVADVHVDPLQPRRLRAGTPRDLETICLKCLAKDPQRRYQTAAELAADLGCYLDEKPISARPVHHVERVFKWIRRQPLAAASIAAFVFATFVGVSGILWQWREATTARQVAEAGLEREKGLHEETDQARQRAEQEAYFQGVARAELELEQGRSGQALATLGNCLPASLRHFEWHRLHRSCDQSIYTAPESIGPLRDVVWSHSGNRIITSLTAPTSVRIHDANTFDVTAELSGHETGPVRALTVSSDGQLLATGADTGVVSIWNVDGRRVARFATGVPVLSLQFVPEPAGLLAGCGDGAVRSWQGASWQAQPVRTLFTSGVSNLDLTSDQRFLVAGSTRGELVGFEYPSAAKRWTAADSDPTRRSVVLAEKLQAVVTAGDSGLVSFWSLADGSRLPQVWQVDDAISKLALNAEQDILAATTQSGLLRMWDIARRRERARLTGHQAAALSCSFAHSSARLVSIGRDQRLKVWNVPVDQLGPVWHEPARSVQCLAVNPETEAVAIGCTDGTVMELDAATATSRATYQEHGGMVVNMWVRGSSFVSASQDGSIYHWQKEEATLVAKVEHPITAALGHVHGELFAVTSGVQLYLLSTANSSAVVVTSLPSLQGKVRCLSSAGQADSFATAGDDGRIVIRDWRSGEPERSWQAHQGPVWDLCLLTQSKQLVSGGSDSRLRWWDLATMQQLFERPVPDRVIDICVSPDESRIAALCRNGIICLFDVTGREITTITWSSRGRAIAFGPRGTSLFGGGHDQLLRRW